MKLNKITAKIISRLRIWLMWQFKTSKRELHYGMQALKAQTLNLRNIQNAKSSKVIITLYFRFGLSPFYSRAIY